MCGIIGVIGPGDNNDASPSWASYDAYRGLLTMQHRGQDAAGLLCYDAYSKSFSQHKDLGLIANVFDKDEIERLKGNMAIAHTRYATAGSDKRNDIQPLASGLSYGVGMVHNGNILNYHSLTEFLRNKYQLQLLTNNDLEIILGIWCHELLKQRNSNGVHFDFKSGKKAVRKVFATVIGGYSVIGMVGGKGMFAFRDPQGLRPLVLGKKRRENKKEEERHHSYCFSSESIAINFLGYQFVRDIAPGEFIFIDTDGNVQTEVVSAKNKKVAHCMFEWIYFSASESVMAKKSVYSSRLNLGQIMAAKTKHVLKKQNIIPDAVVPIPDTSRPSAIALSDELKIPYREALIKNRYIQRSFILNSQEARERAIELKLSPIISEIEGKNILLVDDSIVRGTTTIKIVSLLRAYGAKNIVIVSTCPPIRYPCYYGIDFPTSSELIAHNRTKSEIAHFIGVSNVIYLDIRDLDKAIGIRNLCKACLNGKYPTNTEDGEIFAARRGEKK